MSLKNFAIRNKWWNHEQDKMWETFANKQNLNSFIQDLYENHKKAVEEYNEALLYVDSDDEEIEVPEDGTLTEHLKAVRRQNKAWSKCEKALHEYNVVQDHMAWIMEYMERNRIKKEKKEAKQKKKPGVNAPHICKCGETMFEPDSEHDCSLCEVCDEKPGVNDRNDCGCKMLCNDCVIKHDKECEDFKKIGS